MRLRCVSNPTRDKATNSQRTTHLPLTPILARCRGFIPQNILNLLHILRRQLRQQAQRFAVIDNLLRLRRAQDDRADVLVLGRPRERQLRCGTAQLLRERGQLPDLFDLRLAVGRLELLDLRVEDGFVVVEAGTLGDAVVVLAREQAAGERRPDRGAVLELLEERGVFDLEALAVEGVVLRLLGDGGDEVVLLRDLGGLHDLHGGPFARAPVVCQVQVPDGLREAFHDLLHGCSVVGPVRENHVDVWLLQSCQRALQSFDDVFLGEAAGIRFLTAGAEEDFGDEDVFVAGPGEFFECGTHFDFALPIGVDLYIRISLRLWNTIATVRRRLPQRYRMY